MCGIAGFVAHPRERDPLPAMLARLRHRGPDGEGRWDGRAGDRVVSLGHERLSIIDLEGGRQPLSNEDGTRWITFNGEIFNFPELRRDLERAGHVFRTHSDTEAIVHHLEQRGTRGLADLNGMFAFAHWNDATGELLLARDRAGIKPLYWAELADGGVVFASELAALMAHPGAPRALDRDGLASYFFSDYAHPPTTLVRGVHKLAPGHFVVWRAGRVSAPEPFVRVGERRLHVDPSRGDQPLADELWDRLGAAVGRQMLSDVPVGVFLSGGIDSSSVAVLAQQRAGVRLKTFSIGFDDPAFDESAHARLVARHVGSEHVEEILAPSTLLEIVDPALSGLDEPFADPSFLPTWLLSRLAARHVKVALGGDGGDELWAGYPTYKAHLAAPLYGALPAAVRDRVIRPLVDRLPVRDGYQTWEWKAKRFTQRFDRDRATRHLRWMSSADLPDLADALGGAPRPATLDHRPAESGDRVNDTCLLDFTTYLPGSVLTKVDRASMAHGLEARPPFLDNEFVDWSHSVPGRFKLRGRTTKFLLKKAALRHLPPEIVLRPKKGFGIPLATWLRGPLDAHLRRALDTDVLWASGLVEPTWRRWAEEHRAMRVDHAKPLWALVVLATWARRLLT